VFFRYNVTGFQEKLLAGHHGSGHAQLLTHNDSLSVFGYDALDVRLVCLWLYVVTGRPTCC